MLPRFTKYAEGRMERDGIAPADVAEAIAHPTHPPRPVRRRRALARRVHQSGVISVLYEQHAQGPLVVSCWRAVR